MTSQSETTSIDTTPCVNLCGISESQQRQITVTSPATRLRPSVTPLTTRETVTTSASGLTFPTPILQGSGASEHRRAAPKRHVQIVDAEEEVIPVKKGPASLGSEVLPGIFLSNPNTQRGSVVLEPEFTLNEPKRARGARRTERSKSWSGSVRRGDLPSGSVYSESFYAEEGQSEDPESGSEYTQLHLREESADSRTCAVISPQGVVSPAIVGSPSLAASHVSLFQSTTQTFPGFSASRQNTPPSGSLEVHPAQGRNIFRSVTEIEDMPIIDVISVSDAGGERESAFWEASDDEQLSITGLSRAHVTDVLLGDLRGDENSRVSMTEERLLPSLSGDEGTHEDTIEQTDTFVLSEEVELIPDETAAVTVSRTGSGETDSGESSSPESLSTAIGRYNVF